MIRDKCNTPFRLAYYIYSRTAKIERVGHIVAIHGLANTDVHVVWAEDIRAVRGAVHPPIHYGLRSRLPSHVDVLSPAGWVIAVASDAVIAAGAIRSSVGDKAVASHVCAMLSSRVSQLVIHTKCRNARVKALLVDQFKNLIFD